jgi:hypothetical protein
MAYANPSTFVAAQVLTAAQMNVLANNDRFLHGPPTVRVNRDAVQSIAQSAFEEVSFDTEDWDTDTMRSSTDPTKVFARTAGKYLVSVGGLLAASTGGDDRIIGVRKNSTSGDPELGLSASVDEPVSVRRGGQVSGMIALTTGQYVQLVYFHNHSAGINTSTDNFKPTLSMIWMSS